MAKQEAEKSHSRLVQIAAAIVIIWALRYAKEVLVPIALAVLFAFLLAPLVHWLERRRFPRAAAVLIVVLLAFALIGGIGLIVASQVDDFSNHLQEYTKQISDGISRLKSQHGLLSRITQATHDISKEMGGGAATSQPAVAPSASPVLNDVTDAFGSVVSVLATAFIVTVLCIFMLLGREDLRDRVIRLVSHGHLNVTTQAMDDAAKRVSRYLLMQAITNGIYGFIVAGGLLLIGVPNAPLWGLLAALLRFIPYVGPWIGAAGPVLLAFLTRGGHRGFATIGLYAGLEVIISSCVEPWLYGSHTGVSSIAILAAAVFWAWLWGGVGLLLATPLTVLLVVVGKYVPQLEFLSVILGDEPVFDPPTRYYQRLLAADQEEATELIEDYLKEMPVEEVYEKVMIPALGLAHRDRFRGRLDGERSEFIRVAMKEEIEELAEKLDAEEIAVTPETTDDVTPNTYTESMPQNAGRRADGITSAEAARHLIHRTHIAGAEKVQVICLPARDEADELAGMMFAQLLTRNGLKAEAASASALASEMVELVGSKNADIVVISALPPSAVSHARYLCKRIHQAFPDVVIVVGLWTSRADLDRARSKITCTPRDVLVAGFSEGYRQVEQLVHPLILAKESLKGPTEEEIAVKEKPPTDRLHEPSVVRAGPDAS